MTLEELRNIDLMPFDGGAMADGMDGRLTEREDRAQFAVVLRYLDLLVRNMGIPLEIPLMAACLERNSRHSAYSGFPKLKAEVMKRLYDSIMVGTGWSYGICRIGASRLELSENSTAHDWERAVSIVPEVLALGQKGFQDVVVTLCWSERIARYCEYAASHSREIGALFGEEDAIIRRILRKMADPYAVGSCIQRCKDAYVMAYYEGRDSEATITSEDMDYNFFVQGIALHLFLSQAEEMFGLPRYAAQG